MLKEGITSFGVVFALYVLAIVKVGVQKVSILQKRGAHKVLPFLEGGAQKWFELAIFPFCRPPPPLPIINNLSLIGSSVIFQ